MITILRAVFWFERGELGEIVGKIRARKWGYEADWESTVILVLIVGTVASFIANVWLGIVYLWLCKFALQGLNKKRFFDPMP